MVFMFSIPEVMRRTAVGEISDMEYMTRDDVIKRSKRARQRNFHPSCEQPASLIEQIRAELRYIDRMRRTQPTYMWSRAKLLRRELEALKQTRIAVTA